MSDDGGYGTNVARFLADHPRHVLAAGDGGCGYTAQRKDASGRGTGPKVHGLSLDELAGRLETAQERASR